MHFYEVYIDGHEYLSQARFVMAVILELDLQCKLLTKNACARFGFGTCNLEETKLIINLLISLEVPLVSITSMPTS
jgi:hypothetical protein